MPGPDQSPTVRCVFCGVWESMERATEDGWIPTFYLGPTGHDNTDCGPACGRCQARYLTVGDDGESHLKPGTAIPRGE